MPYALEPAIDAPAAAVGIWVSIDRDAFGSELTRFAAETAPLPITLASVGLFPGVANFFALTVTAELLDLHADVSRRLERLGTAPWRHYAPRE